MAYSSGWPKPYAQYNLEIVKNGFVPWRVINVEILEGTTAIQNVVLMPQNGWNNHEQTIVIGEHALYADYPAKIKDYVKNVASCEVYSTWPGAVIRANVPGDHLVCVK